MKLPLSIALALLALAGRPAPAALHGSVSLAPDLATNALEGRLLLLLGTDPQHEPRQTILDSDPDGPYVFGCDAINFSARQPILVDDKAAANRPVKLSALPPGKYFVQALLDVSTDIHEQNAPGNFYSEVQEMQIDANHRGTIAVTLTKQITEPKPPESDLVKYVKIQSRLLSDFHHRPIYLRAGVILPASYNSAPDRRYPLWIHVGGFGTRYHRAADILRFAFAELWSAPHTPQMIYVQVDGAGPNGDCYQVNSANNGPYGHALVRELLPELERQFRAIGGGPGRVLSGRSTGGWVALALQIFYPDEFSGAWAASPDPVDFRAFQLMNIYTEPNAYVNLHGEERPSGRDLSGEVRIVTRREVQVENVLGRGGKWTRSGQQWGAWNAVFSPRGADGWPVPLWDANGRIDPSIAKHWRKYDLRFVLEDNWAELAPRLRGKLHISVGEADDYFLNEAVHLLDEELAKREPKGVATFAYGSRQGHGWMNLKNSELMAEMEAALSTKSVTH